MKLGMLKMIKKIDDLKKILISKHFYLLLDMIIESIELKIQKFSTLQYERED